MGHEEAGVLRSREHVWLGIIKVPSAHKNVERAEGTE